MDRRMGVVYGMLTIGTLFLGLRLFIARSASGGPCESKAACYVTPGGSGATNGLNWNNAYAGLPASLMCGVTYYLAGGSYDYTSTSSTISNACGAGSPLVIYKALSGGPGNPQNVAGWESSYGTSQAFFSQATDPDPENKHKPFFTLSGTYITIDGVVPASGTPTKTATFGIHLRSSNRVMDGFLSVTGANNTVKHVESDGIANPYGFQVTACRRTGGTVTVTTNGNPPWVVGDKIDLYMNGGEPKDFTTVPPSTGWSITSISGNRIQYMQAGADETCTMPAAPNPATVVLNFPHVGAVVVNISANPSNFSYTDNYIHDISDPIHHGGLDGCNHCTYLRNYIARTQGTPTEHVNGIDGAVLNNSIIGQSVFEDISGTSIANPTCGGTCNWQNDVIYSNLVFCTIASQSAYVGLPAGATWQNPQCNTSSIFSDDNGGNRLTNLLIYANTIVRPLNCKIQILNASSTATVTNNFLFCPGQSMQIKGTGVSHSYNTGWGGAINQALTPGTGDYWTKIFPGATSVFVNPSDTGENFHLLSGTVDAPPVTGCTPGTNCLKDGATLSAPYNVDILGSPRGVGGTWARGAFDVVPSPPTSLGVKGVH
ncbi:MAG TPA: hypothetical protein VKO18_09440 [Terriglobia bacterium]|nr:hypothetical protein [Terriglobia bacterium]